MTSIKQIRKRDGRIVKFEKSKITDAVHKALTAIGEQDGILADRLADKVVEHLESQTPKNRIPNVEEIQDIVEHVLMSEGHAKVAKAYILYRRERAKIREAKALLGVQDDLKLTINAAKVLEKRYLRRDETGKVSETPSQMFRRVADDIAKADEIYGSRKSKAKKVADEFYEMMSKLEFLPNCLASDTMVSTKSGLLSLSEIVKNKKSIGVMTDSGSSQATQFFENGPKKAWKVRTEYGYEITATPEHFFRVIDAGGDYAWKQLKDIGPADFLALQRDFLFRDMPIKLVSPDECGKNVGRPRKPVTYPEALTPELAEIIGYAFGDGYVKSLRGTKTTLQLAIDAKDRDLAKRFGKTIYNLFSVRSRIEETKRNCILLNLSYRNVLDFLEINGLLKNAKSGKITVPDTILRADRECVAAFIRGAFEADGHVGLRTIELYTNSIDFAEKIHLLLLGLGIVSKFKKKGAGFRVTINKDGNGRLFVQRIGLSSLRKRLSGKQFLHPKHHKNFIPNQADKLLEWYRLNRNYKLYKKIARFLIDTKYSEVISGFILKRYSDKFPELTHCYLNNLVGLNQFYDKIKTFEEVTVETLDMHVPENNTYVANGFVTHNSPTIMNAGTAIQQLSACYVLPIEDSIEGIFDTLKNTALLQQTGAGTGFSFSRIRPRGSLVKSTGGTALGPVSFLKVYNSVTEAIKSGGRRRGANMGILRVDHPDIVEFIICKEKDASLASFNISVAITDKFMRAVEENKTYNLVDPHTNSVVNRLDARRVWDLLVTMAWKSGDPGIVFIDRINQTESNPTPKLGTIEATNPCLTADSLVSTEKGLVPIKELAEKYPDGGIGLAVGQRLQSGYLFLRGLAYTSDFKAFKTGRKETIKLTTKEGRTLKCTPDHRIMTGLGWKEAGKLTQEDLLAVDSEEGADKVEKIENNGMEDVYDITEPLTNSFIVNGIVVHNCGETPLMPYESCNLGSINLSRMLKKEGDKNLIDWEKLKDRIWKAVHFLDNVIDVNNYTQPEIEKITKANRKIGLGVMGFADMLIQLWVPYNSEEAVKIADKTMKFINSESKKASTSLAKKRGPFPNFRKSIWPKKGYKKLRNAVTTTIAPTGTISIIAGTSSSIEPIFAVSYVRNILDQTELLEVNPFFEKSSKDMGFYSEELMRLVSRQGSIQHLKEIPDDVKRIFVTAHDIGPEDHIKIQVAFQKNIDLGVSKTVNFPNDATVEDVEKVFMMAYKVGCKGITIYRDKSKSEQVLNIELVRSKIKPRMRKSIGRKRPDEALNKCEVC